ncbi:MAG: hypothetical protein WBZ36_03190 [Candidatus Nitrosopolaris sp.]
MTKNKLFLTSFMAFAMITMVSTAIVTQGAYAVTHMSTIPSVARIIRLLSSESRVPFSEYTSWIPPYTPLCLPDNTKTQSDH